MTDRTDHPTGDDPGDRDACEQPDDAERSPDDTERSPDDAERPLPDRSAISDELGVPDAPPDPETTPHVLAPSQLQYPTFSFDEGEISPTEGFDLRKELDRAELREWLEALAGGLASHDVAVAGPEHRVTFGVGAGDVRMTFDPDESHRGTIQVTFSLPAKALVYSPVDATEVGARGGRGFIPLSMVAEDRPPEEYRCYNWIDDPTAGLDQEGDDSNER